MYTREQLINLRIAHVIIMLATGVFICQYSQLDEAWWIPTSVVAIIGPFSPGLTIAKARQRVFGSIAGLLCSLLLWFFIYYNPNSLVFVSLVLIYALGYAAMQNYTYFIFLVSIIITLSSGYMDLFINNQVSYVVDRMMCVLIGVTICQFYEYFIFKHYYHNSIALVESERLDKLITEISQNPINSITQCNKHISTIIEELTRLEELKLSCESGYSNQEQTLELISVYTNKLEKQYTYVMSSGGVIINKL